MSKTSKFCKYSNNISCHKTYFDAWQNSEEQKYDILLTKCYDCPVHSIRNKKIIYWYCKNHIHKIGKIHLCCDHIKLSKKN